MHALLKLNLYLLVANGNTTAHLKGTAISAVYQLPHQLACLCKALIHVRHLISTAVDAHTVF